MMNGFTGEGALMLGVSVLARLYAVAFAVVVWLWARSKRHQGTTEALGSLSTVMRAAPVTAVIALLIALTTLAPAFGGKSVSETNLGILTFSGFLVACASLVAWPVVFVQREKLFQALDTEGPRQAEALKRCAAGAGTIAFYEAAIWMVPVLFAAARL